MTIVCAITDGHAAWIGSDTHDTTGFDVGFKGILWKGAALGISGELFALQAFQHWLADEPMPVEPVELALHLRELARQHKMGRWDDGTMMLDMTALYVRPSEIWYMNGDFTMARLSDGNVQAIGAGCEVAQGALWGAMRAGKRFTQAKDARAAVKFSVEAAIAKHRQCGGEVVIHRVR